jgi:hypothetical protein
MALLRCHKCGYLREVSEQYIGQSVQCPVCQQVIPVHGTIDFVKKLLQKYVSVYTELRNLQQQLAVPIIPESAPQRQEILDDIDVYNTTVMGQSTQYEPIVQWFEKKQIKIQVDEKAVDTTGFFDEIAVHLGDEYELLKEVSDRIKRAQTNEHTRVTLNLSKYSQKEAEQLNRFCKELYEYSFVAKYFYQKKEKIVNLNLQTAPIITRFFNGEWAEWFVFIKLLSLVYEKKLEFSCLRSFTITFPNQDVHELDVFFLLNGRIPLCIECKAGEFRSQIEKYSKLRQRLNIDKANFLLFVVGLSEEQTRGLTSMYDFTVVNEKTFLQHVSGLLI